MAKRRSSDETRRFWQMAIELQHESGLSISEFCRREGLQPASYYAWRRKLNQVSANGEQMTETDTQQSCLSSRLVPVDVIDDHHGIVEVVSCHRVDTWCVFRKMRQPRTCAAFCKCCTKDAENRHVQYSSASQDFRIAGAD